MSLGKRVRLGRLFSHPSGRLCSVAVDHFIGYGEGLPAGLRNVQGTLAAIVTGKPDAVTMHKGLAGAAWGLKCGTPRAALEIIAQAVQSGARGATIGRNVWGFHKSWPRCRHSKPSSTTPRPPKRQCSLPDRPKPVRSGNLVSRRPAIGR